jgi:hypothetical protein
MRLTVNLFTLIAATIFLFSCKKETEEYTDPGEPLSDYLPLQVGKYITYRADSLVFPNAGRTIERHYYQEKHIIDAQVPDGLGRPSYRVFRYTRDSAGTQGWSPAGTYFITPIVDSNTRLFTRIEVIENNLRVIKLAKSIKQDQTWKGNQYLATDPYITLYGNNFQRDDDMNIWDYTVTETNGSMNIRGVNYNNVVTVQAINELDNVSTNNPNQLVTDVNRLATADISIDKYAKGIGLIYQEYTLWEYQPPTSGNTTGYYNGFSVIRRIIDHN